MITAQGKGAVNEVAMPLEVQ